MADRTRDTLPEMVVEPKRHSFLVDLVIRLVKEKPLATVGGIIVLLMFFTGIFADVLVPYGMNESHLADVLTGPSPKYVLGTDQLGRDLLTRIIYGARVSMIVSLAASALNVGLAVIIGLLSGFFSGKLDLIVQRFVDGWMCFPPLFVILSIMAILGPGILQVVLVLGFIGGIRNSRVVRSAVIGVKENAYVEAAVAIGCPTSRILTRHILPNIMAPIIVLFTLGMAYSILAEATLSFLGFGVPPPMPSWGGMLSGEGRMYMYQAPWMAIWPGVALSIVVFGINMFGDGIRDILDPRLRGSLGRLGGVKVKKSPAKKPAQGSKTTLC